MSDLVERVARGIWAHQEAGFPERVRTSWDAPHELGNAVKEMQRQRCREIARIAIVEVRAEIFGSDEIAMFHKPDVLMFLAEALKETKDAA